jgi:DNA-binding transcriptional LysR family regulator
MIIMRPMHDTAFAVPDFDLLVLFDALAAERHMTRAAAKVGLSQPAMSRALGRLRVLFGDPLLVRTSRGMLLTPRGEELVPSVRRILAEASALVRRTDFEARALARTFVVGTTDYVEARLLPKLTEDLARNAPQVNVVTRPAGAAAFDDLENGRLDLVIIPQRSLPVWLKVQHLFDDTFLCAVRSGHPTVKRKLSLATFLALRHVQIAPMGAPGGPVDDALSARGLSRRVAVRTQSFLAAPLLVANTDFVITAPRTVLESLAKPLHLRTLALPLDVPGFRVVAGWHPRAHDDPAHRWFRGAVKRMFR